MTYVIATNFIICHCEPEGRGNPMIEDAGPDVMPKDRHASLAMTWFPLASSPVAPRNDKVGQHTIANLVNGGANQGERSQ